MEVNSEGPRGSLLCWCELAHLSLRRKPDPPPPGPKVTGASDGGETESGSPLRVLMERLDNKTTSVCRTTPAHRLLLFSVFTTHVVSSHCRERRGLNIRGSSQRSRLAPCFSTPLSSPEVYSILISPGLIYSLTHEWKQFRSVTDSFFIAE